MIKLNIKPLSVNEVWQGKRYKTPAYKNYEKIVLLTLPKIKIPNPPYVIYFEFGFSNSASDWDNPVKPFQDILSKKYNFNDKLIKKAIVCTTTVKKGHEYIKFQIETLEQSKFNIKSIMKSTETFKNTIKNYLNDFAAKDTAFAEKLSNPDKNIDDCITYIMNTVKKSGCNGFADEEIFGMALHYYDESQIEVGKPIQATVVVNHTIDLSEEEKTQAKEKALQQVVDEAKAKMSKRSKPKAKKEDQQSEVIQSSLF